MDDATAVAVLITPVSVNRPWIWFEVGASWSKMVANQRRIYPLCVPEVDKAQLPEPLGRLQALSLGKAAETREFFQALIDQFGFGTLKGFRHASIKAKLPKYDSLKVAEADIESGQLYTGPYGGYSTQELREIIRDDYLQPALRADEDDKPHTFFRFGSGPSIVQGALIHYRRVDAALHLPPGTAEAELISVAAELGLEPVQEFENMVRLRRAKKV